MEDDDANNVINQRSRRTIMIKISHALILISLQAQLMINNLLVLKKLMMLMSEGMSLMMK